MSSSIQDTFKQQLLFKDCGCCSMRLGILGCGAIGGDVARKLAGVEGIKSIVVFDSEESVLRKLKDEVSEVQIVQSVKELIDASDVVCEAASQDAVREYAELMLLSGKDIIVMSVGALYDQDFFSRLKGIAKKNGSKIRIPSGALCGIDGVLAGFYAGIDEVVLETTKNPRNLGVSASKKTIVFEGSAKEAVRKFPKNINVSAILSIAGIGFDQTKVRIVADPDVERNTHRVIVSGNFGSLESVVENVPNPRNPRSSYMASLAAIACISNLIDPVVVGS